MTKYTKDSKAEPSKVKYKKILLKESNCPFCKPLNCGNIWCPYVEELLEELGKTEE